MTAKPATGSGAFERFLLWLSVDRAQALKRHEQIHQKIIKYLVRKGCPDSEELFGVARERVIEIISAGREYDNPDALFYSVARIVWLEDKRKIRPEPLVNDLPGSTRETEHKELVASCLETCLAKLASPEREFILEYYQGRGQGKIEARKRLAVAYGGDNSVRIRAFRIRNKLRPCLNDCMSQAAN